jgi:hypothetical protein
MFRYDNNGLVWFPAKLIQHVMGIEKWRAVAISRLVNGLDDPWLYRGVRNHHWRETPSQEALVLSAVNVVLARPIAISILTIDEDHYLYAEGASDGDPTVFWNDKDGGFEFWSLTEILKAARYDRLGGLN